MTEEFADFIQGSVLPEQACGQRVAKQMRSLSHRVDASVYQCPPHDAGDSDGVGKTTYGSSMSEEDSATGTAWAAGTQIACDSLAHISWQGHMCQASTLATDGDVSVIPIDII